MSLVIIDAIVLNKILANQIQQHIKRITDHNQMGYIQGMQEFLIYINLSMRYTILQLEGQKQYDHLSRCRKIF